MRRPGGAVRAAAPPAIYNSNHPVLCDGAIRFLVGFRLCCRPPVSMYNWLLVSSRGGAAPGWHRGLAAKWHVHETGPVGPECHHEGRHGVVASFMGGAAI